MNTLTFRKLGKLISKLSPKQLDHPVRIIAMDDCDVNPVFKFNGGVIANDLELSVSSHDIYNVRTPYVYGTSSFSLTRMKKNYHKDVDFEMILSKGMPFLCVLPAI